MSPRVPLLLLLTAAGAAAQLTRVPNTTLNLPADLPAATAFTTQNALGTLTFSGPLDIASPPGVTNRLFVVERGVGIQMVNLTTMTKSSFLALATYLTAQGRPVDVGSESGILSMAFHPNYNQNGYFYVFYTTTIGGLRYQRLARFTATGTAGNFNAATTADPATEAPLITQRDSAGNHNGGDLAFGPDGYLYFSAGDEGPQYDGADNGRRIAKDFFGAIFRIDVDSKPGSLAPNAHDESSTATAGDSAITAGSYRIPPDNPFVALAQGTGNASYNGFTFPKSAIRTEIYSIGYRNPWRMSFDPETSRLFVADVGQDRYEEVSIVTNGFNAGWSWREGKHAHTPATAPTTAPVGFLGQDPIYEYDHTNDNAGSGNDSVIYGSSITGGVVYRGDRLPELYGKYLLCDYNTGFIVALTQQPNGTWTGVRIGTDNNISGWGYDPRNDDALLIDHGSGTVKRLARSTTTGTAPPATLSATGAFQSLSTLTPNPGLVAYAPNVSFWSDYAIKSRWFAIRNSVDTIGYNPSGNWAFPAGMVWVKHFDIETTRGNPATRRKLETRFLVKTATDVYGLTYKWRADQTEADLVGEEGLTEAIPASSPAQVWRYPSRTECRVCHTPGGGFALSFNSPQLHRSALFGAQMQNQITALSAAGYFTAPSGGVAGLPAYAAAQDTTASLEWRVRSYLAVNCVQCHQPGGATTGYWDARSTTPTDLAGLINGLLVNDGGDPSNRWCVPGDTGRSMILKRLQGAGVNRMPPLGTSERDLVAEQLITDWITAGLPGRQSFTQWQTTHFGAVPGADAAATADPDGDSVENAQEFLLGSPPKAPGAPWQPAVSYAGGSVTLTFDHPAGRAVVVETSTDQQNWTPWEVPGNTSSFPAAGGQRMLSGPMGAGVRSFFRLKISGL